MRTVLQGGDLAGTLAGPSDRLRGRQRRRPGHCADDDSPVHRASDKLAPATAPTAAANATALVAAPARSAAIVAS